MTRKTVLSITFGTLTLTWAGWEIWAAQNPRDDLEPLTSLLVDHVPAPITLAAIAILISWLPGHFVEAYAKRKARTMSEHEHGTTTIVPATPEADAATEPLVTPTTVVSVVSAGIVVLAVFGLPLTNEQTLAIVGFVTVAAPVVLGLWSRRKVFSPATARTMVVDAASTGEVRTEAAEVTVPAPPPIAPPDTPAPRFFTERHGTP